MSDVTIRTNNQYRDTITWFNLTDKERSEFSYLDSEDAQDCATFVRYRNWVYDISEFMRIDDMPDFEGWHGYKSDSFYSGVLIKLHGNGEQVKMGTYCS